MHTGNIVKWTIVRSEGNSPQSGIFVVKSGHLLVGNQNTPLMESQ